MLRLNYTTELAMKFIPCTPGKCTEDGDFCEGCHRTHQEIAETKRLVKSLVSLAQSKGYENHEDFADFIAKNVLNKLNNPIK
jgi:Protein of unknown function (DUF1289)